MRPLSLHFASLAVLSLIVNAAWAQAPQPRTDRTGFEFGGTPEFDSPPVPKNDKEKQAYAALDEMATGKWYLDITTREGRVLRQLAETTGAKRIVDSVRRAVTPPSGWHWPPAPMAVTFSRTKSIRRRSSWPPRTSRKPASMT